MMRRIVVAGGGLAGWMAAAHLRRVLRRAGWTVTVVAPRRRGAGPAAVATGPDFTRFLRAAGIDEAIFMRRCAATYRLASRFEDWIEPGAGHWLPFGPGWPRPNGLDLFHFWLKHHRAGTTADAYADHALQARMAAQGLGPARPDGTSAVLEAGDYGYHLDREALIGFFREIALSEGVRAIEGRIGGGERSAGGDVASLALEDGRTIEGDLFLDCTGPAAVLIGSALGEPWDGSDGNRHCLDTPLPPDPARPSATAYRAVASGWVSEIPLARSTVTTHVADDPDRLDEALGAQGFRPDGDAAHRVLSCGRRVRCWQRNVVALGGAAREIEPLLGFDLHLIQRGLETLVEFLPYGSGERHLRRAYEARMKALDDGARDAVALHYRLSRRGEPLWAQARERSLGQRLSDRLDLYEAAGCIEAPAGTGFDETAYYHTLAAAGLLPRRAFAPADLVDSRESARFLDAIRERTEALAGTMEPHARALERIHGPAPSANPAVSSSLQAPAAAGDPLALLRRSAHGARLVDTVVALGQPFGHEHSVKAGRGGLQTDRYLLSLHRTALGLDAARTLDRLAGGLGLPASARAEAAAAIGEADILHLGFEDGPAGPLYKLYVEWSVEADRAWREGGDDPGSAPILVHRAYKWRPLADAPPVVTLYHWPRVRTVDEIAARLARLSDAGGGGFTVRLADAVLDVVRRDGTGLPHYLEAAEEPGPRLSYDLNLYATGLTVGAIAPILRDAFVELGVPAGEAVEVLTERRDEALGHVAAGVGRDGSPFVTVYSGVAGS